LLIALFMDFHDAVTWKSINNAISKVQGKEEKDLC
jgi:hypothetical protein